MRKNQQQRCDIFNFLVLQPHKGLIMLFHNGFISYGHNGF